MEYKIGDVVWIQGKYKAVVEKDLGEKVNVLLQTHCCFQKNCKSCYGGHLTYQKSLVSLLKLK